MRPAASEKSGWAARLALVTALGITPSAYAYRPFDGTDAAVADVRELEVELQPIGLLYEESQRSLVAPALIANFGIVENWEVVAQGQVEIPAGGESGPSRITQPQLLAKSVLRTGYLQKKSGPSIATEFGILVPEVNVHSGTGAVFNAILSDGGEWGAFHINVQPELATDRHFELFLDTIIEGPHAWHVRPAAEFFLDHHYGLSRTRSALIGALWQVRDKLAFDIGIRRANRDRDRGSITELRAGVTFSVGGGG